MGGASGGYVAAHESIVELLRQRSRPYLFSNTLAPAIVSASLKVLELLQSDEGQALRQRVQNRPCRRPTAAMTQGRGWARRRASPPVCRPVRGLRRQADGRRAGEGPGGRRGG